MNPGNPAPTPTLSPRLPPIPTGSVLKQTTSRCPTCHRPCPAEVVREGPPPGRIILRRVCPDHGAFSATLASDARFYWLAKGHPDNARCGCNPAASPDTACRASDNSPDGSLGRNAAARPDAPFESLATCLALIEVTDSCNLACPTCYADSPVGTAAALRAPSLENLQSRIEGVIQRKGRIEILQLSGGEPTLHPRFLDLLAWTLQHSRIDYVLINTNGVRIARDDAFLDGLRQLHRPGKLQLYLQFDGPHPPGQHELRGTDLRAVREQTLRRCADIPIPVTLAMTVTRTNLPQAWDTIAFGLRHPNVRGVSFQPAFTSGRNPASPNTTPNRILPDRPDRPDPAEIILAAVAASNGLLSVEDFTPLPCGDPNCAIIGYLLRFGDTVRSIREFVDFRQVQGFLRDKVRYQPEDLARCGCESEPLGDLLKRFECDASHTFRIFIKPFMDAWTWDQDRIDRCCTHVIRPDGRLDSFCRYYSGFPDARAGAPA